MTSSLLAAGSLPDEETKSNEEVSFHARTSLNAAEAPQPETAARTSDNSP